MSDHRDDPMGIFEGYGEYDDKQAPMSDQYEDDLVARLLKVESSGDFLGDGEEYGITQSYRNPDGPEAAARITDLTRQLDDARKTGGRLLQRFERFLPEWSREDTEAALAMQTIALNPEQTK